MEGKEGRERGEEEIKRTKIRYVHVPTLTMNVFIMYCEHVLILKKMSSLRNLQQNSHYTKRDCHGALYPGPYLTTGVTGTMASPAQRRQNVRPELRAWPADSCGDAPLGSAGAPRGSSPTRAWPLRASVLRLVRPAVGSAPEGGRLVSVNSLFVSSDRS